MDKIPVNIISGFLGSGKTTAILNILSQKTTDEQWAVIINEFGKISIDSQTLRSFSPTGTVFDISGGCICCSAKGYFQDNLEEIVQSGSYSRIVIEPSGLGGIDMVSDIVSNIPYLKLMPVICLVDIYGIENPRLQPNPIYRMQITKADVIVFSKCDLLTDLAVQDNLISKFKLLFPGKRLNLSKSGNIFLPYLSGNDNYRNPHQNNFRMIMPVNLNLTDRNFKEENFIFTSDAIFNADHLTRFFIDSPQVVRAKGHIRTEKGWNLFNFTLSGCIFEPCQTKEQNEIVIIVEKSGINLLHNLRPEIEKIIIQKL